MLHSNIIMIIFLECIQEMHQLQHCQELLVLRKNSDKVTSSHKEYCSKAGKLFYFVKEVGPVCTNACQEVSQHLENLGEAHWSAVEQLLGCIAN